MAPNRISDIILKLFQRLSLSKDRFTEHTSRVAALLCVFNDEDEFAHTFAVTVQI